MSYRGQVKGGVVVLEPGAALPDGTIVRVEPLAAASAQAEGDTDSDPVFGISALAVDTGIADLATNIDHYLYGHPKATDGG